jgi:hypothetical protein
VVGGVIDNADQWWEVALITLTSGGCCH